MKKIEAAPAPALSRLAALIENDIRRRGLGPGERYLTAREVGRLLGVSTMTANRALQELSARRFLVRHRRSGAVVGDRIGHDRPVSLRAVHLLLPADFFTLEKPLVDLIVAGVHSELPEDAIQFTFVPPQDDLAFVRRFVENARAAGTFGGAVLLLSSPAVQRFFRDSGIPAVVSGSVYPEVEGLPWVDRDQREIGRLLAATALARRPRRIAVLMRDRWGAGDNLMLDGVHAALSAAKVGYDALAVRSFPPDPDLIAGQVRAMLASDGRPGALLCRSSLAADAAAQGAREAGLAVPKDVQIFLADYHANDRRPPRYPHARPTLPPEEHGAHLGRMLKQRAQGRSPEPDHVVIPVTLGEPREK